MSTNAFSLIPHDHDISNPSDSIGVNIDRINMICVNEDQDFTLGTKAYSIYALAFLAPLVNYHNLLMSQVFPIQ